MDLRHHGIEVDAEFWPIEHPTEPPDEDRPMECPMPDSSVMNNEGMHKKQFSESLQRRGKLSALVNKDGTVVMAAEPPVRIVRRRHHTTSHHSNRTVAPLTSIASLPPIQMQNVTIFQMLQQFDKFES